MGAGGTRILKTPWPEAPCGGLTGACRPRNGGRKSNAKRQNILANLNRRHPIRRRQPRNWSRANWLTFNATPAIPADLVTVKAADPSAADRIAAYCSRATASAGSDQAAVAAG